MFLSFFFFISANLGGIGGGASVGQTGERERERERERECVLQAWVFLSTMKHVTHAPKFTRICLCFLGIAPAAFTSSFSGNGEFLRTICKYLVEKDCSNSLNFI